MTALDDTDRAIVNGLQGGFPISATPFADAAAELGMGEGELMARIKGLLDSGVLSRFGPMYHAEKLGGALVLAAIAVPAGDYARVEAAVNGFAEVAHNYERDHALNMWFVVATETEAEADDVFRRIEEATGLPVLPMPKEREFFVGLRFDA